jgi:23S rRNA pseudouridine1911/1915/1917 synthase
MILYEDDRMIAVNKPAGMVVHPTYRNTGGTLVDVLREWGLARPSIVGRLDKLTSGVVIAAKDAEAHAALQRALASPSATKEYVALVHGRVGETCGRIDLRIRVDPQDRRRVVTSRDQGAPSVTLFERLRVGERDFSLLMCRPLSGRRHQIRAHLAATGWPIVGDPIYGPPSDFPRQALHLWRVMVDNPCSANTSGPPGPPEKVFLEAPFHDDFDALLTLLS